MDLPKKPPYYPEIEPCSYGHNHIIREYLNWPDDIPLPISFPHSLSGNTVLNNIWIRKKDEKDFLINRGDFAANGMHVCGHPIIYLPEIKDIDRKGTLALPRHPVTNHPTLNSFFDYFYDNFERYCRKVVLLPDKFKPVNVCLCNRMFKRAIPICDKYGIEYVLSGRSDSLFSHRLQSIFSKYEHITSYVGDPMWFALLWNHKFFLMDESDVGPLYPQTLYEAFSKRRVETSQELCNKYVDLNKYLGIGFKKTKEELSLLMEKCKTDINYKLWVEIYKESGKDVYFMHRIRKRLNTHPPT